MNRDNKAEISKAFETEKLHLICDIEVQIETLVKLNNRQDDGHSATRLTHIHALRLLANGIANLDLTR